MKPHQSAKTTTDTKCSPKTTKPHIKLWPLSPLRPFYSSVSSPFPTSPVYTPKSLVSIHPSSQHPSSFSPLPVVSDSTSPRKYAPSFSDTPPWPSWSSSSTPSSSPASAGADPHTHARTTARGLEKKMTRWSCCARGRVRTAPTQALDKAVDTRRRAGSLELMDRRGGRYMAVAPCLGLNTCSICIPAFQYTSGEHVEGLRSLFL
jgi:hypothetical protein